LHFRFAFSLAITYNQRGKVTLQTYKLTNQRISFMCAIFGVFGANSAGGDAAGNNTRENIVKAPSLTVTGLHNQQHRGTDYVGIVSTDGTHLYREAGPGLAHTFFTEERLCRLHGPHALGHLRYPTVADHCNRDNTQPIVGRYGDWPIAVAHNGNITNVEKLREENPQVRLSTSLDTEWVLRLLEKHCTGSIRTDLRHICSLLKGSYALGILLPNQLIAVCDPSGNRPLSIGILADGRYVLASEDCTFPSVEAKKVCDVAPGTMTIISSADIKHVSLSSAQPSLLPESGLKPCRFEGIYFGHPGSVIFGQQVAEFRVALGKALEEESPVPGADIVAPIPDSAIFIAMGFGESGHSGRFFPAITKNHHVGRTFIVPSQDARDTAVSRKFIFNTSYIAGKNIVLVDDSVVRGTTLPKVVGVLRKLGARQVHVRIGSPPIKHPCKYGINTPTSTELLAAEMSVDEIRQHVGADSLAFLSLDRLKSLTNVSNGSNGSSGFCYACMDGSYW
jgi:amidophosphoribosyltransferase